METCVLADYLTAKYTTLVAVENAVENAKISITEALSMNDVAG